MKIFVAVTDYDWFELLRSIPNLEEVNFWQPSGKRRFRALELGELFLFKLHSPRNYIVGGGIFAYSTIMPSSLAWSAFGEANGARSLAEMRQRIEKYRSAPQIAREDYNIGCILLQQPFLFHESDWLAQPTDFAKNIVQGKTYDDATVHGRRLLDAVEAAVRRSEVREPHESGELLFESATVRRRLGQGTFRLLVTDTYDRRCAVTGEKALPTLDAAHILPVSEGGQHRVDNGLLLRSDVHRLFDAGYVTVTPDHRFRVSQRIKKDFHNGEPYFPFHGSEIRLPKNEDQRPSREFLEWHADTCFLG